MTCIRGDLFERLLDDPEEYRKYQRIVHNTPRVWLCDLSQKPRMRVVLKSPMGARKITCMKNSRSLMDVKQTG